MKVIHVLSTEGWRQATHRDAYDLDTPELMTLILSALQWRRLGYRIEFYTDPCGEAFLERNKIKHLWDKVVMLPNLPRINHRVFWDIYKLVALEMNGGLATICDTDLVLFTEPQDRAIFGHMESITMEPYPQNRDHFERFGFSYGWDWSAEAINTCFIHQIWTEIAERWVRFALGFAEVYSDYLTREGGNAGWQFEPALFASQRLLGMMLADHTQKGPQTQRSLFELPEGACHHRYTKDAFHLWGRKVIYRTCIEPRVQMLNWLRDKICEIDGTKKLLENLHLFKTFTEKDERFQIQCGGRHAMEHDMNDTPLTRTVISNGGHWRAMDPCSGLTRVLRANEPDKIYRGDMLICGALPGETVGKCSMYWNKNLLCELDGSLTDDLASSIWNIPLAGVKSEVRSPKEETV